MRWSLHSRTSLELDRTAAGFFQDSCRRVECLFFRGFIGAEGHVDHDQRALRPAHDRTALQDHHIQRHRHRRLEAMHHIAQGIADQDHIAMAIDERCGMSVI
jgi:hypothetical protein